VQESFERVETQLMLLTSLMSAIENGDIPIMQNYTKDIRLMHR
jgi:hypothetical protein